MAVDRKKFAAVITAVKKAAHNQIPDRMELELAYALLGKFDIEHLKQAALSIIKNPNPPRNFIGAMYEFIVGDPKELTQRMFSDLSEMVTSFWSIELSNAGLEVIKNRFERKYPGMWSHVKDFLPDIISGNNISATRAQFRDAISPIVQRKIATNMKQLESRRFNELRAAGDRRAEPQNQMELGMAEAIKDGMEVTNSNSDSKRKEANKKRKT